MKRHYLLTMLVSLFCFAGFATAQDEVTWDLVEDMPMTAASKNEVNVSEDPVYVSGNWTSEAYSATLTQPDEDNSGIYAPYLGTSVADDYLAVKVTCEPGTYKFSFVHKQKNSGGQAQLVYGSNIGELSEASEIIDIPKKSGALRGETFESNPVEISQAGDYYFAYKVSNAGKFQIRIADFKLYKQHVDEPEPGPEPELPEWGIPTGTTGAASSNNDKNRYVTGVTTSGASPELAYTNNALPGSVFVYTEQGLGVTQGQTFELHVTTSQDMKWCHGVIYADWNRDGDFDDEGEYIVKVGYDSGEPGCPANFGGTAGVGNQDYVLDFTETITVPANAALGTTRLRLQFQDAWHSGSDSHTAMDVIDKGGVYDFDVTITEGVPAVTHTVLWAEPENGAITAVDGEGASLDNGGTVVEGSSVTFTFAAAEGYELSSVLLNDDDVTAEVVDGVLTVKSVEGDINVVATFTLVEQPGEEFGVIYSNRLSSSAVTGIDGTAIGGSKNAGVVQAQDSEAGAIFEGENYSAAIDAPYTNDNVYMTVEVAEQGTYKFSYRMRASWWNSDNYGQTPYLDVVFFQADAEGNNSANVSEAFHLEATDVLPGSEYESNTFDLAPGTYRFGVRVTVSNLMAYNAALYLGDFKLSMLGATEPVEPADPNTAIHLAGVTTADGNVPHNRFYFDDTLLGEHTNGSSAGDNRSRTFTYSAWIKVNEARGRVMGYGQKNFWGPTPTFHVVIDNGYYTLYHRGLLSGGGFGSDQTEQTSQAVELGEWAFVTLVFDDATKTRAFYYNGQQLFSGAYTGEGLGMLPDESVFYIGDGTLGTNSNYSDDPDMDLDEVQVWTKALTPDEVRASMSNVDPSADGLVYLYRFGAERMNEDYTFDNLAISAAVTGDVKAAYYSGNISYQQSQWATVYSGTVAQPTFVAGHDAVVTPEPEEYTVTWAEPENGSIEVTVGPGIVLQSGATVEAGAYITVTATADEGYQLETLTVGGEPFTSGESYVVEANTEIVATFTEIPPTMYTVSWSGDNCDITVETAEGTPVDNGGEVAEGTVLTITAEAADGYELESLTVNGEDFESGSTWTVAGDVTIAAVTVELPTMYTVSWSGDNCDITVETAEGTPVENGSEVAEGTVLTITAEAADGYELESLTVNGNDFENGTTWTVAGDVAIVAKVRGTGIGATAADGIYYDAASATLHVSGTCALSIYDVTGRKLVDTEAEGTFDASGLRDGIYIAVVDGKVVKFRK